MASTLTVSLTTALQALRSISQMRKLRLREQSGLALPSLAMRLDLCPRVSRQSMRKETSPVLFAREGRGSAAQRLGQDHRLEEPDSWG